MQAIYKDVKYRDISFKLDSGFVFDAHRVVLANSKVEWFEKLLSGRFGDIKKGIVEVHEVSDLSFELALKCCYGIERRIASVCEVEHYIYASLMFIQPELIDRLLLSGEMKSDRYKLEFIKHAHPHHPTFASRIHNLAIDWSYCFNEFKARNIDVDLLRFIVFQTNSNHLLVLHAASDCLETWFSTTFDDEPKPSFEHRDITIKLLEMRLRTNRYRMANDLKDFELLIKEGYLNVKDWQKACKEPELTYIVLVVEEQIRIGKLTMFKPDSEGDVILGYWNMYRDSPGRNSPTHYIVEL